MRDEPDVRPSRGEIWTVTLDPTVGHEQAGTRPALIVSTDGFNHGPAGLVIVVPITSRDKRNPLHITVDPPEAGLTVRGYIKCEDIRAISTWRLTRRWGSVSPETLREVEDRLRIVLDL